MRSNAGRGRSVGKRYFGCNRTTRYAVVAAVLVVLGLFLGAEAYAQAIGGIPIPKVSIGVDAAKGPEDVAVSLQILFLLTILSLAPAILIMMTSFTRIVIVLSFLRQALGSQQTPSNQILVGLSIFMTFFVMAPVFDQVRGEAVTPYLAGRIQAEVREKEVDGKTVSENVLPFQIAVERAMQPIRKFMWAQIGTKNVADVALFMNMSGLSRPRTPQDVPTSVLIPAFIISELKIAFQIGFLIFMPFLVVDLVTSSVLMSMGMFQLPPIMISMPFKILLFVLVDGWRLIAESLGRSFIT